MFLKRSFLKISAVSQKNICVCRPFANFTEKNQIIKIQNNNIQNNSDITSAGSKDECQVDTCQIYDVKSLSDWTSEKETYRVDFGTNDRFRSCTCLSFRQKQFLCKHFFLVIENGYRNFTDISPMYRNHPFIILDEQLFQGRNDSLNTTSFTQLAREVIKEHVSSSFAIAFAVDVYFGLLPNESCYSVIKMCNHLSTCLELQELSPFPKISRRVSRSRLFQLYVDIFCVCR